MKRIFDFVLNLVCFPVWVVVIPFVDMIDCKSCHYFYYLRFNFSCWLHRLTGNYDIWV